MTLGQLRISIKEFWFRIVSYYYNFFKRQILINNIMSKDVVSVGFIILDVSVWKTESLYREMLNDKRFNPTLLVCHDHIDKRDSIVSYLLSKKYNWVEIGKSETISDKIKIDILFYQKPYPTVVPNNISFTKNLNSLFCYSNYAFHTISEKWSLDSWYLNSCWKIFFENEKTIDGARQIMRNHGKNCVVTGLPFTDDFILYKKKTSNRSWKSCGKKKRVIYAPHFSFSNDDILHFSTFLSFGETMRKIVEKYSSDVQFSFKPHPLLRSRLETYWGKQKTDEYYEWWNNQDNTQFDDGKYIDLFMESDALIHDCCSFTVEYHYTQKPVLYLLNKGRDRGYSLNDFGEKAFELHYKADSEKDIESFILNVINDNDSLIELRRKFYNDYLLPPFGKSASSNIIDSLFNK